MFDSRFVWKKRGEGRQRRHVEVSSSYTKDSNGATLYIGRDNVAVEKDWILLVQKCTISWAFMNNEM